MGRQKARRGEGDHGEPRKKGMDRRLGGVRTGEDRTDRGGPGCGRPCPDGDPGSKLKAR